MAYTSVIPVYRLDNAAHMLFHSIIYAFAALCKWVSGRIDKKTNFNPAKTCTA